MSAARPRDGRPHLSTSSRRAAFSCASPASRLAAAHRRARRRCACAAAAAALGGDAVLGYAAHARALHPGEPVLRPDDRRPRSASTARFSPSPTPTCRARPGPRSSTARRSSPPNKRGRGPDRALPCHRRHDLVEPAALRTLRRHAPPHRRARRNGPTTIGAEARNADAAERRRRACILDGYGIFTRAAGERPAPVPRDFAERATRRTSARLLRPGRRERSRSTPWLPATACTRSTSRLASGVAPRSMARRPSICRAALLTLALVLLRCIDTLAVALAQRPLASRALGGRMRRAGRALALLACASRPLPARPSAARRPGTRRRSRGKASTAALVTRLAYVVTGDAADRRRRSKAGLAGLTQRPRQPHGARARRADRRRSVAGRARLLSRSSTGRSSRAGRIRREAAIRRLDAFMKGGGTVIFDTRDALTARPGGAAEPGGAIICAACSPTLDIPGARAGAARSRADEDLLHPRQLPRPLRHGPDLGRGPAAGGRGRGAPAGPRRRRRLADHHHLERPRRRLGRRPPRRSALSASSAAIRASAKWRCAAASTS